MVGILINFLTGFFKPGASQVAGLGNGLLFYGGIAYGVWWTLSDAAVAWSVMLNARELGFYMMLGGVLFEMFRRMQPPSV